MTLEEIRAMPTCHGEIHESVMRSYHVLNKVIELVSAGTPKEVTLEIWRDLAFAPDKPTKD